MAAQKVLNAALEASITRMPTWLQSNLRLKPERSLIPSNDIEIELLTWGQVGRPGLLLVPGLSAHADWWSHIAPAFLPNYRIAAISMAGMGESGWRRSYAYPDFAQDLYRCAQAARLYESPEAPVFIGHSVGGWTVMYAAATHPERMSAAIMLDVGVGEPPSTRRGTHAAAADGSFKTLGEATSRYRFNSEETCGGDPLKTFVALHSLKAIDQASNDTRWTWKADPEAIRKLDGSAFDTLITGERVPAVHIIGDRSHMMVSTDGDQMPPLRPLFRSLRISDAGHNLMIDQPRSLIAALKSVLSTLPESGALP